MFHVASTKETPVPPEVICAPSEQEVDTNAAVPVECDISKSSLGLEKPESEHLSLGFRFQEVKMEFNMKGVSEFSKKSDPKPSDLLSPVVASPVSLKDIISKNQKVKSQLNPLSFEAEMQQTAPVPKLYQDTDGQRIQPSGQQSTKLDQSSSKASFNMVSDLSKTGFQKIADVGYSTAFGGRSPVDIPGQSNHKNLPNSVGTGEQLLGNIGGKSSFLCVSLICFVSSICK